MGLEIACELVFEINLQSLFCLPNQPKLFHRLGKVFVLMIGSA